MFQAVYPIYLLRFLYIQTLVGISGFLNHSSSTYHEVFHVSLRCPGGTFSHPSPLGNSLGAAPEAKTPWDHHHHPRLVIHVKLMDENGKPRPIRGSPFRPTLTKCLGQTVVWDDDFHREKLWGERKNKGGFFFGGWIF